MRMDSAGRAVCTEEYMKYMGSDEKEISRQAGYVKVLGEIVTLY